MLEHEPEILLPFPKAGSRITMRALPSTPSRHGHPRSSGSGLKDFFCVGELKDGRDGAYGATFLVVDRDKVHGQVPNLRYQKRLDLCLIDMQHSVRHLQAVTNPHAWCVEGPNKSWP